MHPNDDTIPALFARRPDIGNVHDRIAVELIIR